jgi:DNA polymerase III epsilon subunit family exonuclease
VPVISHRRAGGVACILLALAAAASAAPGDKASGPFPTPSTPVSDVTFVAFDTETTGFSPEDDRVIEVGAVKFRNGRVIEERSWLLDPKRYIPKGVQRVHGISNEDVKGQSAFKEFYPEFEEFIDGAVLMAHNARFDVSFMSAEIRRAGLARPRNPVIDSLRLFRRWFPASESHDLSSVAEYAKVRTDVLHRAAADSLYVVLIFEKGLRKRKDGLTLRELFSESRGTLRF